MYERRVNNFVTESSKFNRFLSDPIIMRLTVVSYTPSIFVLR